jgi:hypothetical protein
VERTSTYGIRRRFSADPSDDEMGELDRVDDAEARFGSYRRLTMAPEFRFAPAMGTEGRRP